MATQRALVTGGAGFIGSHVTQRLLDDGIPVTLVDNFTSGDIKNLQEVDGNPGLTIIKKDLKKPLGLKALIEKCDLIYHLAANPEVRIGETEPRIHFEENVAVTFNLLEAIRLASARKTLVFTSTSTVYGEARAIPTREDYGPLIPISTYGASKLACEALITSYARTFNHKALIVRLANIVGPRSNHGVIPDFIKKIVADGNELSILGDGTQTKSYLHIQDCVQAIIHLTKLTERSSMNADIYNIGSRDTISVKEIAKIVSRTVKKPNMKLAFDGGVDGGRGWKGDVKTMQLDISKILQTGWAPKYDSAQAVALTSEILAEKAKLI